MIEVLDEFLKYTTTFEKRAMLLNATRVVESVAGDDFIFTIQQIITDEDDCSTNEKIDSIQDSLLGVYVTVFKRFSIYLDEELIEPQALTNFADVLEALLAIELNEDLVGLRAILDSADDSQEILVESLELVGKGYGYRFEEYLERVETTFVDRLRDAVREASVTENHLPDVTDKYRDRKVAFRKKYAETSMVVALVAAGANLNFDPSITIDLISKQLDEKDPERCALELYALVVFSTVNDVDVRTRTAALIESLNFDPKDALLVSTAFSKLAE